MRRHKTRHPLIIGGILIGLMMAMAPQSAAVAGAGLDESNISDKLTSESIQTGSIAPKETGTAPPRASTAALPPEFWVMNMNLCNSGVADCYDRNLGFAVPEAQDVIFNVAPDVVTFQEVCLSDVQSALAPTFGQRWPGNWIFWAFIPAFNRNTLEAVTCEDGRGDFGNAVIGRVPEADWDGVEVFGNIYNTQHESGNLRSYVCVNAVGNYHTCGTHLTHLSEATALNQCNELMGGVIPAIRFLWGYQPTVIGGDFNLRYRTTTLPWQRNIQDCVPDGWFRKGDQGNQGGENENITHIMATDDFTFIDSVNIVLQHTDHPAWLVIMDSP